MSKAAHWIAVVLCVCALWALGGCGAGESSSSASEYVGSSSSDKSGASSESSSGASLPVEPPKPVRPEKPFGFERLDPEQQEMYRLLESGTITEQAPYRFPAGMVETSEETHPMLVALRLYELNHRTLSWREPAYYARYNESGEELDCVEAAIGFDNRGNDAVMQERFEAASAEWLSLLPGPEADDYTKLKAVAELLCERVSYNYPAAYGYGYDELTAEEREICRYTHSEYGALVNGSAICTGYAAAFEYLCDQLGIYCLQVRGDAGRNQSTVHVWNLVWLDGAYYYVDTTWMDNESGVWDYTYLLASEAQLWSDHFYPHYADTFGLEDDPFWRELLRLPVADCDTGGYFDREGLRFETAEQAVAYLERECAVGKSLQIQLTTEKEYYLALHGIERILVSHGEDNNLVVRLTQENASARTLRVEGELYW